PEIFTYGHRNAQGLAWHPETGEPWATEIGPLGGDELNRLIPGGNYGWPLVSLGKIYTGNLASEQSWWRPGMEMPVMFWAPPRLLRGEIAGVDLAERYQRPTVVA